MLLYLEVENPRLTVQKLKNKQTDKAHNFILTARTAFFWDLGHPKDKKHNVKGKSSPICSF